MLVDQDLKSIPSVFIASFAEGKCDSGRGVDVEKFSCLGFVLCGGCTFGNVFFCSFRVGA